MKKERKPKHFIKTPGYPGGPEALKKFIKENLRYPKEASEKKIEGTVAIRFDIDHTGRVTDAKVKHGLGYGCDEEAIRLVKMLKFGGAKNRGVKVVFHKSINIHFHLRQLKKPVTKITYSLTNEQQATEKPDRKPNTYTYTIITNG